MELSINLFGGCKCNGLCDYCSAHLLKEENPVIDLNAIVSTIKKTKYIVEGFNRGEKLMVNLWGGEPLIHLQYFDPIIERLEKEFGDKIGGYFLSTNGIPLSDKKVIEWIYNLNKIKPTRLQLSHDGLGQYYRTKLFDPFYCENTKNVLIKLANDGIFNLINCTMSSKNPSMFANMFYFNKWLLDNNLSDKVEIKLNHINDSDYCTDYNFDGEELSEYIHETEILFMDAYAIYKKADATNYGGKNVPKWWKPFINYFYNQLMRDGLYTSPGGCGLFSSGESDETWCINTRGEYVACQLWDTNDGIQNMDLKMPEYCDDCEYKKYDECHPCPNSTYPEKCAYHKEFIRMILRLKEFRALYDDIYNSLNNNCRCTCNCGDGTCDCCDEHR
jgi:hypothetical protein